MALRKAWRSPARDGGSGAERDGISSGRAFVCTLRSRLTRTMAVDQSRRHARIRQNQSLVDRPEPAEFASDGLERGLAKSFWPEPSPLQRVDTEQVDDGKRGSLLLSD